jgi:hypothetical protein
MRKVKTKWTGRDLNPRLVHPIPVLPDFFMIRKYRNTGASIPVFRHLEKHEGIFKFSEKNLIFLEKTEKFSVISCNSIFQIFSELQFDQNMNFSFFHQQILQKKFLMM